MKLFIALTAGILLSYPSLLMAQQTGAGEGSSGNGMFQSYTLRLPKRDESSYPLCGKKFRDVVPLRSLLPWMRVEYTCAKPENEIKSQSVKSLLIALMDGHSELKFLDYDRFVSLIVSNEIQVDARLVVSFDRNKAHPLLGSQYIVFNIDSGKNICYVKFNEMVGLIDLNEKTKSNNLEGK